MQGGALRTALLEFYGCIKIEEVHPLQGGIFRRKYRTDRRYGMPLESLFVFYPKYLSAPRRRVSLVEEGTTQTVVGLIW